MFKPTNAKTPEEYIEMIEDPQRREEVQKLHELILKTVPGQKPFIIAGMIGYGPYHYKSKSGREGEWSLIALASQKNYISLYVCAMDGENYLPETSKALFPKASIGKSCIRFKKTADIDLEVLKGFLKKAEKAPKMGEES